MDIAIDDTIAPTTAFEVPPTGSNFLSYDDTVPYEEQIQVDSELTTSSSLADRIGRGKVYLLSDSVGTAGSSSGRSTGKRKTLDGTEEEENTVVEDADMDEDPNLRSNALFFTGPPIAHLPTTRIFAYATHFDAHPLGLEWVSDTTCVLVFPSKTAARKAYQALLKSSTEEPSVEDGSVTAKPIPMALWPADERISRTLALALGKNQVKDTKDREKDGEKKGLRAPLRMRWARQDDVKKKGAKRESEFYRIHGQLAGKELVNGRDIPTAVGTRKRRREDDEDEVTRARLDDELDAFLAEDRSDVEGEVSGDKNDAIHINRSPKTLAERFSVRDGEDPSASSPLEELLSDSPPASPPSKMRSDYIAADGRTLLQRTSRMRMHSDTNTLDLEGRLTVPLPRRRRGGRGRKELYMDQTPSLSERLRIDEDDRESLKWGPERKKRRGDDESGRWTRGRDVDIDREREARSGRNERPRKTQQELDDELDAFLKQGAGDE